MNTATISLHWCPRTFCLTRQSYPLLHSSAELHRFGSVFKRYEGLTSDKRSVAVRQLVNEHEILLLFWSRHKYYVLLYCTEQVCPRCKTKITTCQRYSNVMKRNVEDVAKVKARIYGNWATIRPAVTTTIDLLSNCPALPEGKSSHTFCLFASRIYSTTILYTITPSYHRWNKIGCRSDQTSIASIESVQPSCFR